MSTGAGQQPSKRKVLRAFAGESLWGWPTTSERATKMREYQASNLELAERNPHEQRVWRRLNQKGAPFRGHWKQQYVWGHRIFDFYCNQVGAAIEVDGATHDRERDLAQDRWHARRSGIITFRVPNGDDRKLERVLLVLRRIARRKERKKMILALAKRQAGFAPLRTGSPTTEQQP